MIETFKAEERTIRYMLSSNNRRYTIPRNQRDYSWELHNFQDLWEDIVNTIYIKEGEIEKVTEHFLGSCVIQSDDKITYSIIDGQQRITTLIVLLSAIMHKFNKLNRNDLEKGTLKYIYGTDDYSVDYFTLNNSLLNPFFESFVIEGNDAILKPLNEQQKKIKQAYDYFSLEIDKISNEKIDYNHYLSKIRDQILDLKIVEIVVEEEVDGYIVFEILNTRGKDLEIQDLIKNWCMKKVNTTTPVDKVKNYWETIKNNIESISTSESTMKNFINHFWIAKYSKLKDDREIYAMLRKEVKSNNVIEFLKELNVSSEIYKVVSKPNDNEINNLFEKKILNFFKNNRITQVKPLLLGLYLNKSNGKLNDNKFMSILKFLYNFYSKYTVICKIPGNEIEKIYYDYAPKIYMDCNMKIIDDFMAEVKKLEPSFQDFNLKFSEKKYSNKHKEFSKFKNAINHIITDIESYYHIREELILGKYTIEHIMQDDGGLISTTVGNLLPLAQKLNESAKANALKEKLTQYGHSEFQMVKNFIKYYGEKDEWGIENINDRTAKLCKLCYDDIWKL